MKHYLTLFCFIIFEIVFAQGSRFMYEYNFVKDINKKDTITKELMYLDITKEGSFFYSRTKFVNDSLSKDDLKKQIESGSTNITIKKFNSGQVDYSVTKNYPNFDIFLNTELESNSYAIKNKKAITWKIESDKKMIDKFEVQKATTNFGGREWTAWFAGEIPFQDGPYKFSGLPGLILEMEDSTKTHQFKFVGNKNMNNEEIKDYFNSKKLSASKTIEVTEEQFTKQWKDYKADPARSLKQTLSSGNISIKISSGGKEINNNSDVIRNLEKRTFEQLKADNNKIEPSLYP